MDNKNKKPIFEPVSAEEAKQIRATCGKTTDYPPSGLECTSGDGSKYSACKNKEEWSWCCWNDSTKHYGRCKQNPVEPDASRPDHMYCDTTGYEQL